VSPCPLGQQGVVELGVDASVCALGLVPYPSAAALAQGAGCFGRLVDEVLKAPGEQIARSLVLLARVGVPAAVLRFVVRPVDEQPRWPVLLP
jgi:hypothetical protein